MGTDAASARQTLHASCVALEGRGLLITGASGSGKSTLAIGLLARGAALIADDRTTLTRRGGGLVAECPAAIRGLVEARGIGLIRTRAVANARLAAVVDLDRVETERLPPPRDVTILNISLPLLHKVESGHFIDALLLYLKAGRSS